MTAPAAHPVEARAALRDLLDDARKVAERLGVAQAAGLSASPLTHREGADTIRALIGALAEYEARLTAVQAERDEARAELDAVDRAFEGLDETDRARRIGHWIGTAAGECTRATAAEVKADRLTAENATLIQERDAARAEFKRETKWWFEHQAWLCEKEAETFARAERSAEQVTTLTARVAALEGALRASEYLTDRYRTCWLGKPVRDLDEAQVAYDTARAALAPETSDVQ